MSFICEECGRRLSVDDVVLINTENKMKKLCQECTDKYRPIVANQRDSYFQQYGFTDLMRFKRIM